MTTPDAYASVRYIVDDVQAAVDFYTTHLGFELRTNPAPAFADVVRGPLRLLLSGPASSGARSTPADAATAGRNRIHLIVDDLDAALHWARQAPPLTWGAVEVRPSATHTIEGTWTTDDCPAPRA